MIKYQRVDLHTLDIELKKKSSLTERISFLRLSYPRFYIAIMTLLKKEDLKRKFMQECKEHEFGETEDYSKYIHGYFLPWLDDQRAAGKITPGKYLFVLQYSNRSKKVDSYLG